MSCHFVQIYCYSQCYSFDNNKERCVFMYLLWAWGSEGGWPVWGSKYTLGPLKSWHGPACAQTGVFFMFFFYSPHRKLYKWRVWEEIWGWRLSFWSLLIWKLILLIKNLNLPSLRCVATVHHLVVTIWVRLRCAAHTLHITVSNEQTCCIYLPHFHSFDPRTGK